MNGQEFELIWNMTRACNFQCKYCYFPHGEHPVGSPLSARTVSDFLDSTGHVWSIQLTGGEPLLYPGIVDICEDLTRNHVIGMDTNLSLPSRVRDFAERVDPSRVRELYVALHVEERERTGGVEHFISSVHTLMERGFSVIVNYVVHPTLEHRFHDDVAFFAAQGVAITPRPFRGEYEGRNYPESYGRRAAAIFGHHPEQGHKVAFNFQGVPCSAGRTLLRMEPDGTIMRCPGDPTVLGNITDGVRLAEGPQPCEKTRCPCRSLDHVRLTEAQSALVDSIKFAVIDDKDASVAALRAFYGEELAHPCAKNNLGVLAWRRGDTAAARSYFQAAALQRPESTTYAGNLHGAEAGGMDFEPLLCVDVTSTFAK